VTPLQLRLEFIVEQGSHTCLLGVDVRTGAQAALHIDLRRWAEIAQDLRRRSPDPVVYMAEGVTLALTFEVAREEWAA
jgi:hypothetical protein